MGLQTSQVPLWAATGWEMLVYTIIWWDVQSWFCTHKCWSQCICETQWLGTCNGHCACWWHGSCRQQSWDPTKNNMRPLQHHWHSWYGMYQMVPWHGSHTRLGMLHYNTLLSNLHWHYLATLQHGRQLHCFHTPWSKCGTKQVHITKIWWIMKENAEDILSCRNRVPHVCLYGNMTQYHICYEQTKSVQCWSWPTSLDRPTMGLSLLKTDEKFCSYSGWYC